jgi:NTE family protein
MKLGIALSGGGFRATVFHLGSLARLAESGQLEDVTFLSTVSGGSLCIALVYALNNYQWPDQRPLPGGSSLQPGGSSPQRISSAR